MNELMIPLSALAGRVVTHWQGTEMALAEGCETSAIRWADASIDFLQLVDLDMRFDDGRAMRLVSRIDDGTGFHGLFLFEIPGLDEPSPQEDASSIFRHRRLPQFPCGALAIVSLRHDGPNSVVEMRLRVAGAEVRLLAAEVHAQRDGSLLIVEPDESMLVQIDGARPPFVSDALARAPVETAARRSSSS